MLTWQKEELSYGLPWWETIAPSQQMDKDLMTVQQELHRADSCQHWAAASKVPASPGL